MKSYEDTTEQEKTDFLNKVMSGGLIDFLKKAYQLPADIQMELIMTYPDLDDRNRATLSMLLAFYEHAYENVPVGKPVPEGFIDRFLAKAVVLTFS